MNALKTNTTNDNGAVDFDREITPKELKALGFDAANDNNPVTIVDIIRDETAKRVYNFEVESLPGQITHNYMVGDDAVLVHNAQRGAGPSGKPKIHVKKYPTRKQAKDAQSNKPGSRGAIRHPSPKVGGRHFHPADCKGNIIKDGTHAGY